MVHTVSPLVLGNGEDEVPGRMRKKEKDFAPGGEGQRNKRVRCNYTITSGLPIFMI